jgi:DNA-binding protein Fis
MEREIIRRVLEQTRNNTTAAARLLGTTRQTLRYRIQKYGLADGDGGG